MNLLILKQCKICKDFKIPDAFYTLSSGIKDAYCKQCRISFQKAQREKLKDAKYIKLIQFYGKYPQFNYTQQHSLAIFAIIDLRSWPFCIEYINKTYSSNFNYKDTYLHLRLIKAGIYRFFTFKRCSICEKVKQTYINSHDQDYVFNILEDDTIPIITKDFSRSNSSKDGWSTNCKNCNATLQIVNAKKKGGAIKVDLNREKFLLTSLDDKCRIKQANASLVFRLQNSPFL